MKRIVKPVLSTLLCFSLLLPNLPAAAAYENVSPWAEAEVSEMDELELIPTCLQDSDMSGKITRSEMCKMAVAVYQKLTGMPCSPVFTDHFTDTSDLEINFAYELGIVSGYGDDTFRPDDLLTRQDFFKITYNLMSNALMWSSQDVTLISLDQFLDIAQISPYAYESTQIMVSIGVVKGDGETINPLDHTARQEAIAMFLRAYHYMADWLKNSTALPEFVGISPWAIDEVLEMYTLGMIPTSLVSVDMSGAINRAQMCSIAMLAYRNVTGVTYIPTGDNYFSDTNEQDINAAFELGIVNGYDDGTFGPNQALTREQFFKIVANFMQAVDYPRSDAQSVNLLNFSDGSSVSPWAVASARLLIHIGAVKGSDGMLLPQENISCQETLVIFLRSYKYTTEWLKDHPDGIDDDIPSLANDIVAFAKTFEGYDYVWGGTTPDGFDCSGFVQYVYGHFGIGITRTATSQYYNDGFHVSQNELLPGDLVFFAEGGDIIHVGLYIGDGMFIHAANSRNGVIITPLSQSWYANRYFGANRIVTE